MSFSAAVVNSINFYCIYFFCLNLKGVPEGVVNFVPADGPVFGDTITKSPYLAGINFTGSVP